MQILLKHEMDFRRMLVKAREDGTLVYADHDSLVIKKLLKGSGDGS